MFSAAIFDMGGLLIDSEPMWRAVEMEIFATLGVILTEDMCRETMGYRADQAVHHWFERFAWSGKSEKEIHDEILKRMEQEIRSNAILMSPKPQPIPWPRSELINIH